MYWVKWRAITLTNKQVSTRLFEKGKLQKRSLKQISKQSKNNSVWKDRWTNLSTNYLAWLPQLHKLTTNEVQSKRKGELNNSKLSRQRIWIQNSNLPQKTERHVFDTLLCLALKVKKSLGQIELCCIKAKKIVYRWETQSVQIGLSHRKAKDQRAKRSGRIGENSLHFGEKSKGQKVKRSKLKGDKGKGKRWMWMNLSVNLYLYIIPPHPVVC